VALKTVRIASEGKLASVRREIQALGRLRHPGVVKILDGGIDEGRPWYAMELLEGGSLHQYLHARRPMTVSRTTQEDLLSPSMNSSVAKLVSGGPPELHPGPIPLPVSRSATSSVHALAPRPDLGPFLSLIRRLCEPLAYVHGEGFIHRDIKPSNVLIRADETPVLMDFGLVWILQEEGSREIVAVDAARAGTVAYMAPEHLRGERIDARADLFSLGCIMYEGITGRQAFPVETTRELAIAHAEGIPPASALVENLPPALDKVVSGLLALHPRDRIGHAMDVAAMLADLGAEGMPASDRPAPRAYLYRPELVGRGPLLDAADEKVTRLREGSGGCFLVTGESGIGKTSLVSAIAHLAVDRGVRVVTGDCAAVGVVAGRGVRQGGPLYPLARLLQAVGDRCVAGGETLTRRMLGERAKVLAACEPTLRNLPGVESYPEPAEIPGEASRRRLIDAMAETLASFASDRPTLLVLDDLQWADDLTLAFLSSLTERYYGENPVLVVATYRAEESTPDLDRLAGLSHSTHFRLDRLDAATIGAMSADMLGQRQVPDTLAAFLTEESSGNPFFVAEYLRAAVDAGLLFRDDRGRWQQSGGGMALDGLGLPHTLQALVTRRLDGLLDTSRRLTEVAAVLGREVQIEVLSALALAVGVADETAFGQTLRNLLVRQILEPSLPGSVRFVHDKLREIAYEGLSAERQARLHAAAAVLLERRHAEAGTLDSVYATLAHHFEKAKDFAKALEYLDKAGEAAHAMHANAEAIGLLERAKSLEMLVSAKASVLARARRERLLGLNALALGNMDLASSSLVEAAGIAGKRWPRSRAGMAARCVLSLARELIRRSLPSSLPLLQPEGVARELLLEAARAYERLLVVHYFVTGNMLAVTLAGLTNMDLAEQAGGASAERALGYATFAAMCSLANLDGIAQSYCQRATQVAKESGDELAETWVLMNVALVHLQAGRWDQTQSTLQQVGLMSLRMGFSRRWEESTAQLGTALFLAGRFREAHDVNERLLGTTERADPQSKCWAVVKRAELHLMGGEATAAVTDAREGERLCRNALGRAEWIYALGALALAYLRSGDAQAAQDAARRCSAWDSKGTAPVFYNIFAYGAVAEVHFRLWTLSTNRQDKHDLEQLVRHAVKRIRAVSRVMVIASPRASLWQGIEAANVDGNVKRARRHFQASLKRARSLSMAHDEGMALAALGEHAISPPDRARYLGEAAELFRRIGARHDLARVERLISDQLRVSPRAP